MKFIWHGPSEALEIKDKGGETLFEGWAMAGKTAVNLPEDHPMRANWEARGWIKPATEEETPAEAPGADESATEETTDAARAPRRARRSSEGA